MNEATGDLLLRWYNMSKQSSELTLGLNIPHEHFYKTTILEEAATPLSKSAAGCLSLLAGPCEIVTIGIRR
ncbi:hypothetical protein D3C81_1678930 [compost metagenome]